MKSWVCKQAEWLVLGGYLLLVSTWMLYQEGLLL